MNSWFIAIIALLLSSCSTYYVKVRVGNCIKDRVSGKVYRIISEVEEMGVIEDISDLDIIHNIWFLNNSDYRDVDCPKDLPDIVVY